MDEITVVRTDDLLAAKGQRVVADHRIVLTLSGYEFNDDAAYQLDLCENSARALREILEPYLKVAAPVTKSGSSTQKHKQQVKRVREWADAQGIELKLTGPLPMEIKKMYSEATGEELDF